MNTEELREWVVAWYETTRTQINQSDGLDETSYLYGRLDALLEVLSTIDNDNQVQRTDRQLNARIGLIR